jgi:hypothetical protein
MDGTQTIAWIEPRPHPIDPDPWPYRITPVFTRPAGDVIAEWVADATARLQDARNRDNLGSW